MAREKLTKEAVEQALATLPGWTLAADGLSISRTFTFKNFSEAFGFMTRAALAAEKLDHHPDWSNVYKTVEVKLNTHDAGGLTELDFELARRMSRYAGAPDPSCETQPVFPHAVRRKCRCPGGKDHGLHEISSRFGRATTRARSARISGAPPRKPARHVPFMEDVVAAYYCALDKETPLRVKGILFAALGYFILPADAIPDVIFGLGFTDDIAVLTAALAAVRAHIKPAHLAAAKEALSQD